MHQAAKLSVVFSQFQAKPDEFHARKPGREFARRWQAGGNG
jgi:hypothetical protein